ncbi:PREDICTED: LOW QUALITY PROTEIN: cleavage and polyadenylation specificity factor subunit 7 [Tinamus guttatus]|uniref:LOW QUALITY PROTEIN: cleavage and polyadenylation specificity factor subunit 7 n=1 Tax=Tinamus guttatus TaxID=94827 RepID=UPI00052EAA8D|nr:PREDICTED: LOW QUALITY PROTEIN: cleavage and polyadenylation specificity factor subunit 7 [Tinamus guttatus]
MGAFCRAVEKSSSMWSSVYWAGGKRMELPDSEFSNADQMDLYDDVLAASSQPAESRTGSSEPPPEIRQEPSPKPNNKSPAILYTYSGLRNKRAAVYVGSFSWLTQPIRSVGVYDVVELKFAENRANGQSKGYAEVVVASENSVHKLLELLPGKVLNGDKVEVRLATRQNLSQFEGQARKLSSSAISKAVSGASAGDYSDAIETLLTAIAVIKQSRVANDERCRVLLSSLKDCLHGIEAKSYSTGASSSSSRKRHRSRERSPRGAPPSRSRESSRRHRDTLHSEDRHEDYFQERNREHDRHRDRDRERDRHH